jgi:hypothetical protein
MSPVLSENTPIPKGYHSVTRRTYRRRARLGQAAFRKGLSERGYVEGNDMRRMA